MQASYEPIVWNETLMTGVAIIDEQHQILVNMLNDANAQLTGNVSRDALEEIVRDLMSYALYHFDTEEELMVEEDYAVADREQHFGEHRDFSKTVAEVQLGLSQGKLITREELLGFLNGWLINHILKTDQQLGKFVLGS
jgi:hemerythrin